MRVNSKINPKYFDRHQKMIDYQVKIFPFTPTLRELEALWGVRSTCTVRYTLVKFVENGLAVVKHSRKSTHYYAVARDWSLLNSGNG